MMFWGIPPAVARGPLWEGSADPKADRRHCSAVTGGTARGRDVECFANRLLLLSCSRLLLVTVRLAFRGRLTFFSTQKSQSPSDP